MVNAAEVRALPRVPPEGLHEVCESADTLLMMRDTAHSPAPVLSLTVIDGGSLDHGVLSPNSRVLVAARSPRTNPTHPNVVSVPTQRLPRALHREIVASAVPDGQRSTSVTTYFSGPPVDSAVINGHNPTMYAVESLLARKLGLAERLEQQTVSFRAALRSEVRAAAGYDNLGPEMVYEDIEMLNVVVEMQGDHPLFPTETASYAPIAWSPVARFLQGVDVRDPQLVYEGFDAIDLCVHGVCLKAAQTTLEALLGRQLFDDATPAAVTGSSLYLGPVARLAGKAT